ncbi:potassium channel family protein [Parasulfitobacter algicola]|uniref:TrkA family potassium uptake protein n=1 Tax=Parasulfitobacter algicola TaxID=2614809 RepID=A0ABX2IVY6_9RHOB|nr:TrkA family potassium uptake protein [Sulfitobacter algicola]NSX54441.1 TrkA family potassium uptake protein [Sulfitobacter algicola]
MAKLKPRNFAVIGLGTFGTTVAEELARFGNYVVGIDRDEKAVNRLADTLSQAVIADGKDEDALKELGIGDFDVVIIAMGQDLEGSIVSAITVKMTGVKEVWAKAVSKMHHRILSKIGVDRVIHPEKEMGQHIAQMLHNPLVRDYVSLGNGFHVVNIVVPERLAGKSLDQLDLHAKFELRCVGVMKGSEYKGSDYASCDLEEGDRLLILGERSNLRRFTDSI